MVLEPDLGFLLAVAGTLALYCEFIRPGLIVPGLLGVSLLMWGCYSLWQNGPTARGLAMIGLSALLYLTEWLIETWLVAGIAGTIVLACGALLLFDGRPRISSLAGCVLSAVLGTATMFLAEGARRARQNKRSDIVDGI